MLQTKSFKLDTHPSSLCYITVVADVSAKYGTQFKRIMFISYATKVIDIELSNSENLNTFTFTGKYSRTTSRQVTWFMHELDRRFDTECLLRVVQQVNPLTLTMGEKVAKGVYEFAKHYWTNGLPLNPDAYYSRVREATGMASENMVHLMPRKEVQHGSGN